MVTKALSRFDELRAERDRAAAELAQQKVIGWPIIRDMAAYELIDTAILGAARLRASVLEALVRTLGVEMDAAERAEVWAGGTAKADLEKYHARRKLMEELPALNPRSVPLLVKDLEQLAGWIVDENMDIDAAFARLYAPQEANVDSI